LFEAFEKTAAKLDSKKGSESCLFFRLFLVDTQRVGLGFRPIRAARAARFQSLTRTAMTRVTPPVYNAGFGKNRTTRKVA
jgi:hypothetical protein